VLLFALLHDSRREHEYDDPGHGERGARLARELHAGGLLDLEAGQMEKLVLAAARTRRWLSGRPWEYEAGEPSDTALAPQ
jgi:HD superfamily phosphodiesterase